MAPPPRLCCSDHGWALVSSVSRNASSMRASLHGRFKVRFESQVNSYFECSHWLVPKGSNGLRAVLEVFANRPFAMEFVICSYQ